MWTNTVSVSYNIAYLPISVISIHAKKNNFRFISTTKNSFKVCDGSDKFMLSDKESVLFIND